MKHLFFVLVFTFCFTTYAQSSKKVYSLPVHPKCKKVGDVKQSAACLKEQIHKHFLKKFDASVGEEVYPKEDRCIKESWVYDKTTDSKELKCVQYRRIAIRVEVTYKINKDGEAEFLSAKAPDQRFVDEAKRVIEKFPKMSPAIGLDGKPAEVTFTKPVTFRV